jgi:hypothetical protein
MTETNLNELARECHQIAVDHGFWDHRLISQARVEGEGAKSFAVTELVDNPSIWPEKLALMHSEISEMLDEQRHDHDEAEEIELVDLLIRALDYAGAKGWDIDRAFSRKMAFNRQRPHLHGRKF